MDSYEKVHRYVNAIISTYEIEEYCGDDPDIYKITEEIIDKYWDKSKIKHEEMAAIKQIINNFVERRK